MNKQDAKALQTYCQEVATNFSNPNRAMNTSKETFTVYDITPLSCDTASCVLQKNTGKRAVVFLYYIRNGASMGWRHFFPTDGHLLGFRAVEAHKLEVEKYNFQFNFD
jgi:hypothetical protein